jgi:predicted RNase H-like nuclease (RuvC/YqgF family)
MTLEQLQKENEVLKRALEVQYNRNKTIEEIEKLIDTLHKHMHHNVEELKELIEKLRPRKAKIIELEITDLYDICYLAVTRYRLVFELEDGNKKSIIEETNNLIQKPYTEKEFLDLCSDKFNLIFV